jgi:hypothetical protein
MNDLIKKLAEQASEIDGDDLLYYHPVFAEKLAKLIISECAALAKSKSEHIEGIKTEDPDDQILLYSLAWQFKEFGYKIKKHFGVEE